MKGGCLLFNFCPTSKQKALKPSAAAQILSLSTPAPCSYSACPSGGPAYNNNHTETNMDIVKYACVQNEDTGAVQNVVSLQEMSWAACVAPCAMSGVKSLPRCQEGLSEV